MEQAWKWHAATGTYSLLAITPAVSVVPLLPPHPTSITLHPSFETIQLKYELMICC